ncbi:MAG TPA: peptidylprolyl isomerase [Candidatus Limnocylindrales bacterium]|nr:peptidylprolyl isomerase [Candidatus Limnocylindrales bacterium]
MTQISKTQFDAMIAALGLTGNTMTNAAAQHNFAESYVTLLALADAAKKAGIDKDPQIVELMKVAQVRALAEGYRQYLQTRSENPSQDEIEAFYKQNTSKFEQVRLERVIIPPVSGRRVSGSAADAVKKVKDLAAESRERAIKGEDMNVLQKDVYKALGMTAPPDADMGQRRRGTLPATIEAELFALKPGEVSKLETEPAGYTIYRLRTRNVPPLAAVREEIIHDLRQGYVSNKIKAAEQQVTPKFNTDFFGSREDKSAVPATGNAAGAGNTVTSPASPKSPTAGANPR